MHGSPTFNLEVGVGDELLSDPDDPVKELSVLLEPWGLVGGRRPGKVVGCLRVP